MSDLRKAASDLAVMSMQSKRYVEETEYKDAVDGVLNLTILSAPADARPEQEETTRTVKHESWCEAWVMGVGAVDEKCTCPAADASSRPATQQETTKRNQEGDPCKNCGKVWGEHFWPGEACDSMGAGVFESSRPATQQETELPPDVGDAPQWLTSVAMCLSRCWRTVEDRTLKREIRNALTLIASRPAEQEERTQYADACPFCGGGAILDKTLRDGCKEGEPDAFAYSVRCRCCASSGGWAKNEAGAWRWWRSRPATASEPPRCEYCGNFKVEHVGGRFCTADGYLTFWPRTTETPE